MKVLKFIVGKQFLIGAALELPPLCYYALALLAAAWSFCLCLNSNTTEGLNVKDDIIAVCC